MFKQFILLLGLTLSLPSQAFKCYITMVKDSCWTNYNVTVDMMDSATGKTILTMVIPEGQSWVRQPFTCEPEETLSFQAKFSPAFWSKDEGKIYAGHHYWNLPKKIKKDQTAWNVTVCYPNSFAGVPFPPDASGKCQCDTQSIPPVGSE